MTNFERALAFVLRHEGGFVDDPDDPGGATNFGITQTTFDIFREVNGLEKISVKFITAAERDAIYLAEYWNAARCDQLPTPLDLVHFDSAVLCGVPTASRMLQQALGVKIDGLLGPTTLSAAQASDRWRSIARYVNNRISYHAADAAMHQKKAKYLHGWLKRVGDLLSAV